MSPSGKAEAFRTVSALILLAILLLPSSASANQGNDLSVLYWARGIERLLTIVFGGISLILGWSLFKTGIIHDQNVEVKSESWLLRFRKVGPGTFFALFGAAILVVAIRNPFSVQQLPPGEEPQAATQTVSYAFKGSDRDHQLDVVRAINTLQATTQSLAESRPEIMAPADKAGSARALRILEEHKADILSGLYADSYDKFKGLYVAETTNPNALLALTENERDRYYEIKRLSTETLDIP
jgi:hypothetical protein